MGFFGIWGSFLLGLLTPLTAVCVLPLYPGFISFLSNQFSGKENKKLFLLFGFVVVLGILIFMLLLGLVFTTLLQKSLTNIIGIISPIAFGILALISLFLIFNIDFSRFIPQYHTMIGKNSLWSAFIFGFFFGGIVIPCNPAFIAAFFARALLITNFASSILNFLAFGIGLGFPLLVLSAISGNWSKQTIKFLTGHKRFINLIAGIIMLVVSLYYLIFVFGVFG